jgi:ATP-dependent Lhr-like helicase
VLRVFDEECVVSAVNALAEDFRKGFIFPNLKRLTVKQYPKNTEAALKSAGFMAQMLDFVLYK